MVVMSVSNFVGFWLSRATVLGFWRLIGLEWYYLTHCRDVKPLQAVEGFLMSLKHRGRANVKSCFCTAHILLPHMCAPSAEMLKNCTCVLPDYGI